MKTLADLKRDAKNRTIMFELIERFGEKKNEIPERLRGIRKIVKVNSTAITLISEHGEKSDLDFPRAKLMEYNDDSLVIYEAGYRELTDEEQTILEDWQKIEDAYYERYPYGDTFCKRLDYFKKCPCPWLVGSEVIKGKCYSKRLKKIKDNSIKGKPVLKYKIHKIIDNEE